MTRLTRMILSAALAGSLLTPGAALAATAPPVVESLDLSTTRVNVTTRAQQITVTAHVTDADGVRSVMASTAPSEGTPGTPVSLTRTSGTASDGVWTGAVTVPRGAQTGPWGVALSATDRTGTADHLMGPWVAVYDDTTGGTLPRFSGSTRYATAASLALHSYGTADTVYVASGESFADALAAGPAAHRRSAPLLLTRRDRLPAETAEALRRLAPRRIVVAGGAGAVSDTVIGQMRALARPGTTITATRAAGGSRYGTAVALGQPALASTPSTVVLASGEDFPDALAAAAYASQRSTALLLSRQGDLPAETRQALARVPAARVVIVGGTSAVGSRVADEIAALGHPVRRFSGADRYATAGAVARQFPDGVPAWIAVGTAFPDALVAASAPEGMVGPVVLVRPTGVPQPSADALTAQRTTWLTLLGGMSVLPAALEWQLSPWFELN